MKLVYILEQFYLHGGIEKITASKLNWLSKNGYDVSLIVNSQKNKEKIYLLDDRIKFIDLDIDYKVGTSYFHPLNLRKLPKHLISLKKVLNKIKPDVIVITSLQFDYYFLPFITNAKIIREFHSSRYYYEIKRQNTKFFLKKLKYKIEDFIESKYTYNVVLTPDEVKHYRNKNTVVIPNGIEIKENSGISDLKNKTVIAAGRLAEVKNFEELIEIWSKIAIKFPDWTLKIYGEGDTDYKQKLINLIDKNDLNKQICLCGSTDELDKKMLDSSIYVMTSKTECFPMVLLEALNVGLPIVSYDCPYGPKNIIKANEDGFLVEYNNKKDFIFKLSLLMSDFNLRQKMGGWGNKNIKEKQLDFVMKKWIKLFNK